MEPTHTFAKGLKPILSILVLIFIVVTALWMFEVRSRKNDNPYSVRYTPYSVLIQENTFFIQAEAAAAAGDYEEAKRLYRLAFEAAQDSTLRGQVEFKIAALEDQYGSDMAAIDMYKKIVANPEYENYPMVKAYAISAMVEMYYEGGDTRITNEIFKDAPYAGMFEIGKAGLAYKRLEEYSISFFPLALPELRLAGWYASQMNSGAADAASYPQYIRDAVSVANKDLERTKKDTNAAVLVPRILVRKASLFLNLFEMNSATKEETEPILQDAVSIFTTVGKPQNDGYARYYYAVFLSMQKPERVADVQAVLAPFYTTEQYANSPVFSFFANEKTNNLQQKKRLQVLAAQDPKFRDLLISLKWNEQDL